MADPTKKETQAVEEFFTKTSEYYADHFVVRRTGQHFEFRQRLEVANEMTSTARGSVLDCAAGSGEITASIIATGRFSQVTAVDLTPRMLELAKRQIEASVRGQPPVEVELVNADIFRFATGNATRRFNLILCLGLIAHTGRLHELLTGLSRMLHPDGAILLQATLSDHPGVRLYRTLTYKRQIRRQGYRISSFRQRDIFQAAQDAGLKVVARRRYALGIPFGDRIWARGNYFMEKTFQGWARSHGAEEIYLLKLGGASGAN